MGGNDKFLRSAAKGQDDEEALIQRVVEKILTSDKLWSKLVDTIALKVEAEFEKRVNALQEKVVLLENKLENVHDTLEQYSRANNIRIYGLPETKSEDVDEVVINLCQNQLGVDVHKQDIDICHRLAHKGRDGNRPMIVRFCRRSVKNIVFSSKSKLKGSKVVIREDLTRRRVGLLNEAIAIFGAKKVWTSGGKIMCAVNDQVHKLITHNDLSKLIPKQ